MRKKRADYEFDPGGGTNTEIFSITKLSVWKTVYVITVSEKKFSQSVDNSKDDIFEPSANTVAIIHTSCIKN